MVRKCLQNSENFLQNSRSLDNLVINYKHGKKTMILLTSFYC